MSVKIKRIAVPGMGVSAQSVRVPGGVQAESVVLYPLPGPVGPAAGFGTPSATASKLNPAAAPTVAVTASGEDTAKIFAFAFGIPQGVKGDTGFAPSVAITQITNGHHIAITNESGIVSADVMDGRGITSITRTGGNGAAGTVDTYTITYNDSTTSTFTVQNGANGRAVISITRTAGTGAAGTKDTYTIAYSDSTTSTFQVTNGANGRGISGIARTSGDGSAGSNDVYTITYTDNTTSTFTVHNGVNGTSSGDVTQDQISWASF